MKDTTASLNDVKTISSVNKDGTQASSFHLIIQSSASHVVIFLTQPYHI